MVEEDSIQDYKQAFKFQHINEKQNKKEFRAYLFCTPMVVESSPSSSKLSSKLSPMTIFNTSSKLYLLTNSPRAQMPPQALKTLNC